MRLSAPRSPVPSPTVGLLPHRTEDAPTPLSRCLRPARARLAARRLPGVAGSEGWSGLPGLVVLDGVAHMREEVGVEAVEVPAVVPFHDGGAESAMTMAHLMSRVCHLLMGTGWRWRQRGPISLVE